MRANMRSLATAILLISGAAAAQNAKQAPEVPYVPTTQAAVEAMLKLAGVEQLVRFEENDLFKANIREASVVTLFLLTSVNARLRPKLLQELRSGTRVVSNTFDMGDWKPQKEFTVDTGDEGYFSKKLYLWTIPQRVSK